MTPMRVFSRWSPTGRIAPGKSALRAIAIHALFRRPNAARSSVHLIDANQATQSGGVDTARREMDGQDLNGPAVDLLSHVSSASPPMTQEAVIAAAVAVRPGEQRREEVRMPWSPRIASWIIAGNLLVALVLTATTVANLQTGRDVDLDRARDAAENLAHVLGSELAAELRLVDNALTTAALRYERAGYAPGSEHVLKLALKEQEKLLPFVSALRTADASGHVKREFADGAASFSIADRDYFKSAESSEGMIISEPMLSRAFDGWCVIAAKRLRSSDGQFHGIVYATLSSAHFHGLFRAIDLGKDGAVSLRTDSLRLVARYVAADPESVKDLGSTQVSDQLRTELSLNREAGSYITPTALDGVERVTAYRRLPGYPLTVLAGLSTDHYLAPWRSTALRHWFFTGLTLLLVAAGSAMLYVLHLREYRARVHAARLATEQSLLLDNELVGMLRVKERRILWANRAACRMLGYDSKQLCGAATRMLYAEESSYTLVGEQGYPSLHAGGKFRTQLQVRTFDGRAMWVDLSGAMLLESESIWMMTDIDKLKHSEAHANHLALHDPLTGLANRRLLELQLRQALAQRRRSGLEVAVGYIDLDGFKPVNDELGHEAGDAVLRTVAARLLREVRANDTVARMGGDEFALVLADVEGRDGAMGILQRSIEAIQLPIALDGGVQITVGCSIGLVLSGDKVMSAEKLLQTADEAMYAAKRAGRRQIVCAPEVPAQADVST